MKRAPENDSIVVGCFADAASAQRAIRMLRDAGFSDHDIGVISHDSHGDFHVTTVDDSGTSKAGPGAAIGAAAGASGAALWALGVAAGVLPAIGPIIAGGLLAAVLASAAGGAVAGSVVGALIGLGVPDEDAAYYHEELRKGSTIVVVASKDRAADAMDLLRMCGSYNRYEQPRIPSIDAANPPAVP